MKLCALLWTVTGLTLPGCAFAHCQLQQLVDLAVTMNGLRPEVQAKINGSDAAFALDSGSWFNMLSPAAAAQFKLSLNPLHAYATGFNGTFLLSSATVKELTLAGHQFKNVAFLVGGSDVAYGQVGVLGQNLLRIWDTEYDLSNGIIRLVRAVDCRGIALAYWARAKSQPYSAIPVSSTTESQPHTISKAYVNGIELRVMFDTGAPTSIMSLRAAARAGVTPETAGALEAGYWTGFGRGSVKTWIAPFSSFGIGDEEVRNTRLRFGGDPIVGDIDMLVGADFFLSHHILVATSQRMMYFTYNGGPVFNLTAGQSGRSGGAEPGSGSSDPATAAGTSAPSVPQNGNSAAPPTDAADEGARAKEAAEAASRGTALSARRDFAHAIPELTRACQLGPNEAQYFHERARAYRDNNQPDHALDDLNKALELKPDLFAALVDRAILRIGADQKAALADLDAADRYAPKEADVRFAMGELYTGAGAFRSAITQYDDWIAVHGVDARKGFALAARCRDRALLGEELDKALSDCNAGLHWSSRSSLALESRGLVYLRGGDLKKAVEDFNAALKLTPRSAWSLYGRGLARIRAGNTAEGDSDLTAAKALKPKIEDWAKAQGLSPE